MSMGGGVLGGADVFEHAAYAQRREVVKERGGALGGPQRAYPERRSEGNSSGRGPVKAIIPQKIKSKRRTEIGGKGWNQRAPNGGGADKKKKGGLFNYGSKKNRRKGGKKG